MAKINEGSFRDWNDGETVKARDYKQEREIIRVAVNDTHDRFLDEQANFQQLKDVVEENMPKIEAFEEIATDVEQKGNYALAQGDYAKGQGNAIQEALEKSVNIIKQPTVPSGIVEGRIWADTSDNTYQGTVFNELTTQLAQKAKQYYVDVKKDFGAKGDYNPDTKIGTDDTQAFQNALNSGKDVFVPRGNYRIAGQLTIPESFWRSNFFGEGSEYTGTSRLFFETTSLAKIICNAAGIRFTNLTFEVPQTIRDTNDCFISAFRLQNNVPDLDITIRNCGFTGLPYALIAKGRNITLENNLAFDMSNALVKIDFVDSIYNQDHTDPYIYNNMQSGMRGFIFSGNRLHYTRSYLIENTGANAHNITGVHITNNFLEGGMIVKGVLKDALVTGNNIFQLSTAKAVFDCTKIQNVTITGNTFKGEDSVNGLFETSMENLMICPDVENLVFTDNFISNVRANVFLFNGVSNKINISDNIARRINTISGSYVVFIGTEHKNITVKDKVNSPERSNWVAVNKGGATVVRDYEVNMHIIGTTFERIHGLEPTHHSSNFTNRSNRQTGQFIGNNAGARTLVLKYKPSVFKLFTEDGSTTIAKTCDSTKSTKLTFGSSGVTIDSTLNQTGLEYYWEAY